MKVRAVPMLLSLAMLLSLVPPNAWAAEAEPAEPIQKIGVTADAAVNPETPLSGGTEVAPQEPKLLVKGQWQNAPVVQDGETVKIQFDGLQEDLAADHYWIAVNVPRDGMALEVQYTDFTAYELKTRVFQQNVLETDGPTGAALANINYHNNGYSLTRRVILNAGAYYLMLDGSSNPVVSSLKVSLHDGDANEPNNSWETATDLTVNVPTKMTIHAGDDTDWFRLRTTEPGEAFKLFLTGFDYTVPDLTADIYRVIDQKAEKVEKVRPWQIGDDMEWTYKTNEPGEYYVHFVLDNWYRDGGYKAGFDNDTPLSLRYELIPGDQYELNDSRETATQLPEGQTVAFTLNGGNDEDFFFFETTLPNQKVELNFSGFATNYSNFLSYSVSRLDQGKPVTVAGQTDINKTHTNSLILKEPGRYDLRIYNQHYSTTDSDTWHSVEHPLMLHVRLLESADTAEEPNNTWQTAHPLRQEIDQTFSLPASGDVDWFILTVDKPNQTLNMDLTTPNKSVDYEIYAGSDLKRYDHDKNKALSTGRTVGRNSINLMLEDEGTYYIRLKSESPSHIFQEGGVICYHLTAPDAQEPNNSWKTASPVREMVDTVFTLPAQNDKDWFKITVDDPDQTVKLTFSNVSTSQYRWSLYAEDDFIHDGDKASPINGKEHGSGTATDYCMLRGADNYYVCVTSSLHPEEMTMRYELIAPDAQERNNSWQTAAEIRENTDIRFTLPAWNDHDWFKIIVREPNQTIRLSFADVPANGGLEWTLYDEADLKNHNDPSRYKLDSGSQWSGGSVACFMLDQPGAYYLQVKPRYHSSTYYPFRETAVLRYELIAPDAQENNDSWKTAAQLRESVDTVFTLPAWNDTDWFKITVNEPDQTAKLTFSNVPFDGDYDHYFYFSVYQEQDFQLHGDDADPIDGAAIRDATRQGYVMLEEPGNYYVRVHRRSSPGFEECPEEMTLRYDLIRPDDNENNNTLEKATLLAPGQITYFTLPARNDQDYFRLDCPIHAGDVIRMRIRNWDDADIWVQEPNKNPRQVSTVQFKAPDNILTLDRYGSFKATVDGTYYIQLKYPDPYVTDISDSLDAPSPLRFTVSGTQTAVENIHIMDHLSILPITHQLTLNTEITPYNATNQNVTWTSSAPEIASVDADGTVTALSVGEATITVQTEDGSYQDSCVMHIVQPIAATGVTITPAYSDTEPKPLTLDSYVDLQATVLPETATNRNVTWSSSDPKILAVTDYGRVYAVGSGKAKITVTTEDGQWTADTWFSVPDESYPVTSITLDQTALTLYMNEEGVQLNATVRPEYATNPELEWHSEKEAIATVDQTGLVKAVAQGETLITVTAKENPNIKAECRVSVQPERIRVKGISFEKTEVDVGLYAQYQLKPVITPANATVQDVVWTSSNKVVATVSRNGLVTTLGLGCATITATTKDGGHVAEVRVNVSPTAELGDINNDGSIDVGDAIYILRYSVDLMAMTPEQRLLADTSGDGLVDVADAILILRYATGLIDTFPGTVK